MRPLDGVRVLDLCRTVPGAYCSMLLGDMGADVILIEQPGRPREWRQVPESADPVRAAAYNALGRNKRSIAIDLKNPEGLAAFRSLLGRADVVLEGFRPGVADRLGVGYAAAQAAHPRIVYASISGYGQTGPYAAFAGHDINYAALGGALGMIGRAGAPPSVPMNFVADLAGGGLLAAYGIVLALFARERSGRGQEVDVGMTDGVLALLSRLGGTFFESGIVPRPGEHRLNGGLAHYDVYRCADGKYLAVGPLEATFRERLCGALGLGPCEGEVLRHGLESRLALRTRDEWFAVLGTADACVAPVYALDEVWDDPHVQARQMRLEVVHPTLGMVPQVGIAPKLGATPGAVRHTTPMLGADTMEILQEAGHDGPAIDRLLASGAVWAPA